MDQFLIDTNICIYYIKGLYQLDKKFRDVGVDNCFISEITLAELKFGVEKSAKPEMNHTVLEDFLSPIQIIPIFHSLDLYAKEKARLYKAGQPLDDFDLLIGVTAVTHDLKMGTNNIRHFERIQGIEIIDWVSIAT